MLVLLHLWPRHMHMGEKERREERERSTSPTVKPCKRVPPASPAAPQGARFGVGSPMQFLAKSGEKQALGGLTEAFFFGQHQKSGPGGLVGGTAGDALIM